MIAPAAKPPTIPAAVPQPRQCASAGDDNAAAMNTAAAKTIGIRFMGVLSGLGPKSTPIIGPALLLARADRQAKEGAWEEAVSSYEQYLARFPDSSAAPQALESRDTLTAMLSAQAELTRQREEVTRLRDELTALKDEGTRLREGGTRLRAESTVLRAEVIRLRDERTQLRDETKHLRQELTRRQDDLARTRQELAAQQAEAERLRADIERLKQIDLKLERKR